MAAIGVEQNCRREVGLFIMLAVPCLEFLKHESKLITGLILGENIFLIRMFDYLVEVGMD